jgi:hypothetical protein
MYYSIGLTDIRFTQFTKYALLIELIKMFSEIHPYLNVANSKLNEPFLTECMV